MEKRKTSPKRVIAFVILGIGACTMVLPFLWMLSTSLKDANLVYAIPPQWIPNPVDWENYCDIWSAANLLTGGFNLLPVPPLDGAQLASCLCEMRRAGKKFKGND